MRGLLLAVAVIFTVSAQAKVEREVIQAAKQQFNQMSATEAYASNAFVKQVPNLWMPGTSTWLNPVTSLCIRSGNLETVKPVTTCTAWTGRNSDGEIETYARKYDADKFLRHPECSATASRMASAPLDYKYVGCVLWSVSKDGETKYYNSKGAADRHGNANCAQEATISAPLSTTFTVNFYVHEIDSRNLIGSRTYAIGTCGGGVVPPVPAN